MRRRRVQRGRESSPILGQIDLIAFCLFLALAIIGWLMVFSVGYDEFLTLGWDGFMSTSAGKQATWIGICGLIFAFIMLLDFKFWQTFAYPVYAFGIVLLILVLFLGTSIKGATSWFTFGSFSFQPSEIAKFGTSLALSAFLASYSTNLKHLRAQLVSFGIIGIPILFIIAQPDAGSALVFFSLFIPLYRAGLPNVYYIIGGSLGGLLIGSLMLEPLQATVGLLVLGLAIMAYHLKSKRRNYWILGVLLIAVLAYFAVKEGYTRYLAGMASVLFVGAAYVLYRQRNGRLAAQLSFFLVVGVGIAFAANYGFNNVLKPHQQDRINVWLKPGLSDERGALYNLAQSKTAIGSGGLEGKGFLQGTMTKGNFVPEQSTDFIFCTIGEEQGFIGSLGIVILFFLLLLRITVIAERQRSNFSRYYAYCVAGILFLHVFINIGMTMGLTPIIGIPLPFISKGGSSLMGFTIMIAVMLKLDKHRYRV